MGYSNATGPSIRHTITLSPRLTEAVERYCREHGSGEQPLSTSEAARRAFALLLGDKSLAAMNPRGQPKKISVEEPAKTQGKRKLSRKSKISHKKG